MLVLLPPSETKTPGGRGPAIAPGSLVLPELDELRWRIAAQLAALCSADPAGALRVLGLSEALDAERAANATLLTATTAPAAKRYTGVLYEAAGLARLPGPAGRVAARSVLVCSALWGVVALTDRLPRYRLGIGARLPGRAGLPTVWSRSPLPRLLEEKVGDAGGALDMRSSGYAGMWRPRTRGLVTPVRVVGADGRAAPSYHGKKVKGMLLRQMAVSGAVDASSLAEAARAIGAEPELGAVLWVRLPRGWVG